LDSPGRQVEVYVGTLVSVQDVAVLARHLNEFVEVNVAARASAVELEHLRGAKQGTCRQQPHLTSRRASDAEYQVF
jgi:hypothetical protein